MKLPAEDLKAGARVVATARALEDWRRRRPSDWYAPTEPGQPADDGRALGWTANQLAFHRAPHIVRALFPGNGWGKTTALGAEVNAWGFHTNQWQATPTWPVAMLWFTKLYEQFELIRMQLEADIFGADVVPSEGGYRWPDGSRLFVGSADRPRDWKKWQGIPLDLGVFDEEPPLSLWREMMMRRRARKKTRFVLGATATEPGSWMEGDIYTPWLEHHAGQGLDLENAARVQNHPDFFVWPRGGIRDNRAADAEDLEWYEKQVWRSPKEKEVRLWGGFQDWIGDPVFDAEALARLKHRARILEAAGPAPAIGMFEVDPKFERPARDRDEPRPEHGKPVTALTPEQLRGCRFVLSRVLDPRGAVTIYIPPSDGLTPVIGADFAYGLDGRDLDTAFVFDKSQRPVRTLAKAVGRWGENFDRVLYALAVFYGGAFILGERQVGLPILRRLLNQYWYTYLYYGRSEEDRRRPVTDKLGHPRRYDDVTLRNFRRALIDEAFTTRATDLLDQMGRLKYHNPTEITSGERGEDFRLKIKLTGGGSPDLVMGACYAWHAIGEVEHFEKPAPMFAAGTMGEALGYEELFKEADRQEGKGEGVMFVRRPQPRPRKR